MIWKVIGFAGQGVFASRFLVQWIASERRGDSVIPQYFWYASLAGSLLLASYAIYTGDPVFIVGQSLGAFIYLRNLRLRRTTQKA
jgi:lipid-A-disaccharide synthase-like uncharacterized protein